METETKGVAEPATVSVSARDYGDGEVNALALAYAAITNRPMREWPRMLVWLRDRLEGDARARGDAIGAENRP